MKRAAACALVALAGLLVLGAATWEPDRPAAELEARWATPPSTFVDVAGMRVHLRDEGPRDDPAPVVLLHGTSASLHTWDGWTDVLSRERRVIRFDLPGFGLTGPFPDDDYRLAHYLSFTSSLLDALGVTRCVLAGNSFGGQIAWELALAEPARVERLVLVDAVGFPLNPESTPIGFRLARAPVASRLMDYFLPRAVIAASVRDVYGDPSRVSDALVERYFELTLREGNRHALAQRMAHIEPDPDTSRMAAIRAPTLILWGARDRLLPPEDAERFAREIAGSELVVLEGLGHVPHEEDPARTAAIVQAFIAR
jgi:pimeloyl-ACP methyl ester carboxylesterase